MGESGWRAGVDSALLVSGATALLFLMGSSFVEAYYHQVGLTGGTLGFDLPHYMSKSVIPMSEALPFAVMVGLMNFAVGHAAKRKQKAKTGRERGGLDPFRLAFIGGSWFLALTALPLLPVWPAMPLLFQALARGAVVGAALGWVWWRAQRQGLRPQADPWMQGFQGVGAAVMLILSASFIGHVQGDEAADGCEPVQVVHFTPMPPGLDGNKTYWLILHQGGNFHVRDASLRKDDRTHITVPESSVQSAAVEGERRLRDDC